MTTEEVLAEIARRGLKVEMRSDGRPALVGDKGRISNTLLMVLRWHREEIIKRLPKPQQHREWLWASNHRYVEVPEDEWIWQQSHRHPCGAVWWRYQGEEQWRRVDRSKEDYSKLSDDDARRIRQDHAADKKRVHFSVQREDAALFDGSLDVQEGEAIGPRDADGSARYPTEEPVDGDV